MAARELRSVLAEKGYPVSEQALRCWIKNGDIPSVALNRKRYVHIDNAIAFLSCGIVDRVQV